MLVLKTGLQVAAESGVRSFGEAAAEVSQALLTVLDDSLEIGDLQSQEVELLGSLRDRNR